MWEVLQQQHQQQQQQQLQLHPHNDNNRNVADHQVSLQPGCMQILLVVHIVVGATGRRQTYELLMSMQRVGGWMGGWVVGLWHRKWAPRS